MFKIITKPTKEGEIQNYVQYRNESEQGCEMIMFDTVADMTEACKVNVGNGTWKIGNSAGDDKWTFGSDYPTLKETNGALDTGTVKQAYIDAVDKTKYDLLQKHPELLELERSAHMKKRKRKFSESGDELDIDRYMGGEVDMWQSNPRREVKQSIKVMLNIAASSGKNFETFRKNMVLFVAMLDVLNTAGISTEVWVGALGVDTVTNTKESWVCAMAKGSQEPLDISRLLSFGLSGFFRYHTFRIWENVLGGGGVTNWSYGSVMAGACRQDAKDFLNFDMVINGTNFEENAYIILKDLKEIVSPELAMIEDEDF